MITVTIPRGTNFRQQVWAKKYSTHLGSATVTAVGELPLGISVTALVDTIYARIYVHGTTNVYPDQWAVVLNLTLDFSGYGVSSEHHVAVPLDLILTGEPDPNAVIPAPSLPPPDSGGGVTLVDFRTALARARSGARVRRVGWEDRWLSWDGHFLLTLVHPLTGTHITSRIPRSTDVSPEWWSARWQVL